MYSPLPFLLPLLLVRSIDAAPRARGCRADANGIPTLLGANSSLAATADFAKASTWSHRHHSTNATVPVTKGRPETPSSSGKTTIATTSVHVTTKDSSTIATPSKVVSTASPSPTNIGAASGNQVGLGWNGNSGSHIASFRSTGSQLAWYYSWALDAFPNMDGLEFVPQVWGSATVGSVKSASSSWPAGTDHVLSFNEPDQSAANGGSSMDATTAASLHQQWVTELGGSYLIGSPAVARGGNAWMNNWITACDKKCKYDFVPFHFYGTDANDLITYAKQFSTDYGKPLWLTEWACQDFESGAICTASEVEAFMKTAITWFRGEGKDIMQRWAWFGTWSEASNKNNPNYVENADGTANAVGTYYVGL